MLWINLGLRKNKMIASVSDNRLANLEFRIYLESRYNLKIPVLGKEGGVGKVMTTFQNVHIK